jgi:hypothetical protein
MAQDIFNGFIASFVLAGFWTVGRVIARINGLLNSRRITARERGIQKARSIERVTHRVEAVTFEVTENEGHGS